MIRKLNSGHSMPTLIFGTYNLKGQDVSPTLATAYQAGFRHIDTATLYQNESEIGSWLQSSHNPRSSYFLTTKVWPTDYRNVESSLKSSLTSLKTDYIDLLLLHWPVALTSSKHSSDYSHIDRFPLHKVWAQMESLQQTGKVLNIGVSNWNVSLLNDLLSYAQIPPVCNQFEMHLYNKKKELIDFCNQHQIVPVAYRTIFKPTDDSKYKLKDWTCDNELVLDLAKKYKKSPQQILIRWTLQSHCGVVVKSSNSERIKENWEVLGFELDQNDVKALASVKDRGGYTNSHKTLGIYLE